MSKRRKVEARATLRTLPTDTLRTIAGFVLSHDRANLQHALKIPMLTTMDAIMVEMLHANWKHLLQRDELMVNYDKTRGIQFQISGFHHPIRGNTFCIAVNCTSTPERMLWHVHSPANWRIQEWTGLANPQTGAVLESVIPAVGYFASLGPEQGCEVMKLRCAEIIAFASVIWSLGPLCLYVRHNE
jgi:hypothetical protein